VEPLKHLLVSTVIGLFGFLSTGSFFILFFTIIFGFFVDFDHYLEFLKTSGLRRALKIKEVVSSKHFIESNRLILIFHSWEYVALLCILTIFYKFDTILVFITLGYSSHIILDFVGNYDLKGYSYFILIRIIYKFDRGKLVKQDYLHATGNIRNSVRLKLN
jgi:hypothetical protein